MASDGEASCSSDPNFAVICSFLERFAKSCGITHPNISELQEMLENTQEVPQPLIELHVKLLRKARKSVSGERWERALIKFCHTYSSNQDGWEIERFGYKKARLGVKLRVLKTLLEQQFDLNAKFKAEINRLSAMELRCTPLGRDKLGQTYWCQLDEACNLRVYREDLDDETWEVVASDREGLVQLISQLSSNDPFRSGSEVVNEDSNSVGVDKPVTDTGQPKSSGSRDNDEEEDDDDDEEFQEIPSSDLEEDDSDYDSDSKHNKEDIKPSSDSKHHKEDIKPSSDSKHQKEDIKPSTDSKHQKEDIKPSTDSKHPEEDTECSSDNIHQKEALKPSCDIKHEKDNVHPKSDNKQQKEDIKHSSGVKIEKENEKSDSGNKLKKEGITPSSDSKHQKDIKTDTEGVSSSEEIVTEQKGEDKAEEGIKHDAMEKQESVSLPTCTAFEKDEKLKKQIPATLDLKNSCVEKSSDSSETNSCREKVVADSNVSLSNKDCKLTENEKSDSNSPEGKQITDDGSPGIVAPSSNSPISSKQGSMSGVSISDSPKKINKDVSSTSAKRSTTPTDDSVPAKRLRGTDSEKATEPEVSEAIEEPVMVISGEGSGKECNTGNPVTYGDSGENDLEVSEAIEETVMFIYGEGSGKECDTGNPMKQGDTNENEQGENGDNSDLSEKENLSSNEAGKVSDENVSVTNSKSESLEDSVCGKKLHEEKCGASSSQNSPSASTSSCTADISVNLEGNKSLSNQEHTTEMKLSTHNAHQSATRNKSLSETAIDSVTDSANRTTEMKQLNTPDHLNEPECNSNIDSNLKEEKHGHNISSEDASETAETFDKLDVPPAVSLITDKGKPLDKNYAYSSISSVDLTKKYLPEDNEKVNKTNLAQQLSVKSIPKLWSIDTICAAKEQCSNDKSELNVPTSNPVDTQTITKIAGETHKAPSVNNNSPPDSLPKCVSRWDTGKPESSLSGECLEEKNKLDEAVSAKHPNSYPNENLQSDMKESNILPKNTETEVTRSCVSEPLTPLTVLSQVNSEKKGVPENFSTLASKDMLTKATESKDKEQSEFGSVKVGKTKPESHSACNSMQNSGISQELPLENTDYSDRKDTQPSISVSKQTGTQKASISSSGRESDASQDRTAEIKAAQLTVDPLKSTGLSEMRREVHEDGMATTLESTESKIKSSLKSEFISGKNAIDSEGSRTDKSLTPPTYNPLNLELSSNKSSAGQMPIQNEAIRNCGKEEFSQKTNKESDILSSQNQSKLSTYRVDTHTSASSQNKFKTGNEIDSGVSIMHLPHKLSEDRILKESKYPPDSLDISSTMIDSNKKTDILNTTKADSETSGRDHLVNISNFSAVNSSLTIEAIPLTKNSQKNCTKNSDEFVKPLNLEKNSLADKVKGRSVSDSVSILPTTLKSRDVHTAKAQQSVPAMGKNRRKSVESITMGIMSKLAAREHQKTAQIKSIDEVMANNISDPHKTPGISSDTRVMDNKDYQPLNLDKMSEKQSSGRTNDFSKPVEFQPPSSIPKKHCNLGFPPEAIHQMGLPPLPPSMLDPLRQLTNLALLSQNPADAAFLSNSLAKRFDDIASRRDVETLGLELLKKSMDGRSIDPAAMALDLQMMGKFAADRKTMLESQMKIPDMHLPGLEKTFNAFPAEKLNMKDSADISNLMKATDVNKLAELSLIKNFVSEPLAVKEQAWLCGSGVPLHSKAEMQGHFNLPYGANAATHLYDEKMRLLSGASNTSVRDKGESKRLNEEVKHRDNRHVKRTETRRELGIENIRNKSLAYYSAVKDLSNVHRDHEPSKAYPYGMPVPSRGSVAPPPKSNDSPLENLPQDLTVSSSKHGTNFSLKSPDITLKATELPVPQKTEAIPLVKGAPYKNITIESLSDEPMAKDYSSVSNVNIKKQGLPQKFNTIPVSQNLPTQNFEKCTVPQPFQTNLADRVPENMKPLDMKLPTMTPLQQPPPSLPPPAAATTTEVPKEKIHYGLKVKPLEKLSEVKLSEIVDIAKEKVPDSKSSLNEVVICSKPEIQKLDSSKTPPLEKLEAVAYPVVKPDVEKPFSNGIKVVPLERLSEASSVPDICGVKDNTPSSEAALSDTKTDQKLDKNESVIEPFSTKVHPQPTENKEKSGDIISEKKNDTEEKCQSEVVITKDCLKKSSDVGSPPSKSVPSEEDEKRRTSDQRPIVGKIQVRSFAKECKQKFSNVEKQVTSEKREQSGPEKEISNLSPKSLTLSKCKSPEVKDSEDIKDQTENKCTAQNNRPVASELVTQQKESEPVLNAEDNTSERKKPQQSKNSSGGTAIKLKLRSRRKSPLTPIRSDSPEKVELSKDKGKASKAAVNEEVKSSESNPNAGKVPIKKSAHGKMTDASKDKPKSTTTDMKCELITSDTNASLKEKTPTVEVIRLKIKSPRSINENLSLDFHETVKHDVVDNKNKQTDEPVTEVRRTRGRSGRFVRNTNAGSAKTSVRKHEPSDVSSKQGPSDAVRKQGPSDAVRKQDPSDAARKHEPSDAVRKQDPSDAVRKHEPSDADADTDPEHVVSKMKRTKSARGGRRALETRTRANRETALKKQEAAEVTSSDDGYKDNLQMRLAEFSTDDSQDRSAVKARGSSKKGGSRSKAKARARGAKAARGNRGGRGKSSVSGTRTTVDSPPPSSDTQSDAAKTSKRGQRKPNVLGLDVGVDIAQDESKSDAGPSSDLPMRQSRRIAQIKIKEEAERRKIEELTFLTLKEDELLYKRAKKLESKGSKSDNKKKKKSRKNTDSDEDYTTGEHADASSSKRKGKQQQSQQPQQQQKTNKKKKRKKKSLSARFNENNPWQSSSESSSSAEEEELEQTEEEEEEEEPELVFKSDHEFSPESDLEHGATEDLPLRRARTARKETETEELEDKHACQKCGKSDHPEWILLCDKCDSGWHGSCLRPALMVIPEGDWFCPPCEHATLLGNLQESLKDLDSKLKRRENEELRRKRLAYVGISLDNVLPNKSEKEDPEVSVPGSRRSSSSSSSSDSSSDESEPVYQLRQRRQTVLSYRYNDYDDLIYSAIQDEMEAVKGAGNQGRGKDISTIVNAEKEEQKENLEAGDKKIEDGEAKKKKKEENGEEGEDSEDEEEEDEPEGYIPPVRRYPLPKKKHRRLNSLDISSEDDADSDEDFKGSSSEDEEEEEDDADESEDSDAPGRGRGGRSRKRHAEPVRRSSRARVTRFDKEFINDDSEDSDVPKRKKSRRVWQDSESEESDWGKKRKKKSGGSSSKSRSKKKKRRVFEDSDLESYRKKKPKKPRIKFGGLDEDEVLSRRTRGKKINYEEVAGSDTEEEVIKRSRKLVESEDEFVINEDDAEEEEEREPVVEQDDSSESEKDEEKDKMDDHDDETKGSPASDMKKTNIIKKKKQVIRDDTDESDSTDGSDDEMQQLEEEMERLVEDDKNHVESALESSGPTEAEVCPDNPSERLKDSLKLVEILEDSTTDAPSAEAPKEVTPETLPAAEESTPVQEANRKYVRKKPLPDKKESNQSVCKNQNDAEMAAGTISEQQQPIPAQDDQQSFSQQSDEGSPPPPPGAGVQALRNMLDVPPLRGIMGMQQSFKNYMEPQQGVTPPSPQAPAVGQLSSSVPAQMQKHQPEQQQQPQQPPPQPLPPPQQKPQPPKHQPQQQHSHQQVQQLPLTHHPQLQQPPQQTQPSQQQVQPTPPKQLPQQQQQQQQQQVQPPQPQQQKPQQPPQPLQPQQPHSQIPQKQSPPQQPPQQQPQQKQQQPQQKQQQQPSLQQQLQNRQQLPPLPLLQQPQPLQPQLQQQPVLHQGQPPPMQRLEAMHVKSMHNPPNVVGMQIDRAIDPPPVSNEQHIIRMSGEVQSPPKRKGRGRGKATLAAAAAAEAAMGVGDQTRYPPQSQQPQQQQPQQPQQQQQQQQPPHQQQQSPQPQHYAPHPSPVNSNATGSVITRMLQAQPVSQHSPQSFTAAAAAMGHKYFGSNPDQRYAPVSPGKPGRIPSPYRQATGPPATSSPAMMQQHYTSRPGLIRPPPTNTAPISQPMRSRAPATQPAALYHGSHHPLDPSPSGGGPISVAPGPSVVQRPADGSQQPAPAMAVPVATGSPLGGKPAAGAVPVSLSTPSPQPPPPYTRPRFPPDVPQAAPGAPPAPRHSFSPAAHMHAQPSPPPAPAPQHQQPPHHSLQQGRVPNNYPPYHAPPPPPPPSYHYGNYPPHPTVTVADEGLQHSPYQPASYTDQYVNPAVESPHIQQLPDHSCSESRPYEEDSGGEFGGLVSYFSSQREDDLDA